MKCKNCGGDYRTIELICPFCGTENVVGYIWMAQRSEAELEYECARKAAGKKASPYVINRILGRIAVVMTGICILVYASVGIFYLLMYSGNYIYKTFHHSEVIETMATLYEEQRLPELYLHMEKYNLMGEENYAYTQAALMNFDYEWFVNHKLKFCSMDEEERQQDQYYISYLISWGAGICQRNTGRYQELDPMNQTLYDKYYMEVTDFWRYSLGMTEEEIERAATDESMDSADYDELAELLKERRAWE